MVHNQKVRPFTAEWYKKRLAGAFDSEEECKALRKDLKAIQAGLRGYASLLSEIAGVEDFHKLEEGPLRRL